MALIFVPAVATAAAAVAVVAVVARCPVPVRAYAIALAYAPANAPVVALVVVVADQTYFFLSQPAEEQLGSVTSAPLFSKMRLHMALNNGGS